MDIFQDEGGLGRVRLTSLKKSEDVDSVVELIKEYCDLVKGRTVCVTGIGGSYFKEQLEEELDIK